MVLPKPTCKVTVWYALWFGGVISQYFLKNIQVRPKLSILSAMDAYYLIIFQQNGASTHTTLANRALLQEKCPGLVTSKLNDIKDEK